MISGALELSRRVDMRPTLKYTIWCWNIWRLCERVQCATIPGMSLFLIVFFHSSGCRPYFIFLSFYSVVYSISRDLVL